MQRYIRTQAFTDELENNRYGYPYNPVGFEVAFALDVFGDNAHKEQTWWLSQQLSRCYDWDAHLMRLGTEDPVTHAARLYESTRLPDLAVESPANHQALAIAR